MKLFYHKIRKLYYKYKNVAWIIDDKSYFILANSKINWNDNFYSRNVELIANDVKCKKKEKFQEKLLQELDESTEIRCVQELDESTERRIDTIRRYDIHPNRGPKI